MPQPINDAESYGVRIVPAAVPRGEPYWRVIRVHHLTPEENHGLHHLFVDILDSAGQRLYGSRARVTWEGGSGDLVVDKPASEPGTNFPMFEGGVFSVEALGQPGDTPIPSDRVENLHTNHPAEGEGNAPGQHSFLVVFQQAIAGETAPPPPPEQSTITGRVIRGAGQVVILTKEGGDELSRTTVGADETFQFTGLAAGTYTVQVAGTKLVQKGLVVDGTNSVTAPDMEMPLSNWVAAITKNTSGSTPTNAGRSLIIVSVIGEPDLPVRLFTPYWSGTTNRTGTKPEYGPFACEFGPLQAGTYTVEPEGLGVRRDVWVDGSGQARLEFRRIDVGTANSTIAGTVRNGVGHVLILLRDGSEIARAPISAEGSFRFRGLPAGTYRLKVEGTSVESDDVLLDGTNQVNVPLSLMPAATSEGGTVYGHVAGGAGSVLILLRHGQEVGRQTVAADGSYRFDDVPPGMYVLQVADMDVSSDQFAVAPDASVRVDLTVTETHEQQSMISGRVVGGEGHDVVLEREGQELARTTLGPQTEFEFSGLPAGIYSVRVEGTDARAERIVLDGMNHVKVNLSIEPEERADSVISGVVRHGAGHVLTLLKDNKEVDRVTLGDDEQFRFANLAAGTYTLHVVDTDVDRTNLVLDGANRLEVELRLPASKSVLRGTVANGASLTIVLWGGEPEAEIDRQTLGPDGTYRFAGLPAGSYRLTIEGTPVEATGLHLDGEHDMVVDLTVPFPATNSVIWGQVTGGTGHDLVLAEEDGTEVGRVALDETGDFRFEHLAAGNYRLFVEGTSAEISGLHLDGRNELQANLAVHPSAPPSDRQPIEHYLLAGPPDRERTRIDLLLAQPFILAFAPSCGFSEEEALHADKVTILGNEDSVPAEAEQRLIAQGRQTQRLSGTTSDELMNQIRARIEAGRAFL